MTAETRGKGSALHNLHREQGSWLNKHPILPQERSAAGLRTTNASQRSPSMPSGADSSLTKLCGPQHR